MGDEITYLDLLVLRKVDAEATVEKFGQQINTSFFEAANILGTMKIKGLVDIQSSIGGQSPLVVTGTGTDALATAMQKAAEPIDSLDQAILKAIGGGARELTLLTNTLNIRSTDLAFHLHKLKSQDYIDHDVRSAKVMLSLTEKGFILTGGAVIKPAERNAGGAAPMSGALSASSSPITGATHPLTGTRIGTPAPAHPAVSSSSPSSMPGLASAPKDIQDILVGVAKPAPKPSLGAAYSKSAASASNASTAPSPSVSKQTTLPENALPPVLDKQSMMLSKFEFYVKAYLPYAVLLVLLGVFIAYAWMTGMFKPPAA